MKGRSFDSFAGYCAVLVGVCGFLYAVAFLILARSLPTLGGLLSALFLLLFGLLSTAALTAVYERLRAVSEAAACWALLLGLAGACGAAIHGGNDLSTFIHPSAAAVANAAADLPSPIDPRGLLTFGVAGLALLVISGLIRREGQLPAGLGALGYLSGTLLIILYLARLIVLAPTNPIVLIPAVLNGFIVGPAWYTWLGLALLRRTSQPRLDAAERSTGSTRQLAH